MTNKRQTIAIWIFGAAIAVVLLLAGYYIPALAVIAGLVVFGLRTKDKRPNVEHSDRPPQKTPIESSPTAERGDSYAGRTNRWSQHPGSFERHLQRREANPMFAKEFRDPTDEEIKAAREKDAADFERAEKVTREWIDAVRSLVEPPDRGQVNVGDIAAYHKSSSDVMTICSQAGGMAETYLRQVESIDKTIATEIIKAMEVASPEDAASLREADVRWVAMRAISTHPFFAQCGRKGGPITDEEVLPALLCESTQTVREMVAITKAAMPTETVGWCQQARALSDRAKNAKFTIPAIERKLAILGVPVQALTPAEYVNLDTLRRDLISRSDDREEYLKSIEPHLEELKGKFGDRIPVDQLQEFISAKKADLKTQMKGFVAKAATEGKTISVESLRESMAKAKGEYKGEDREVFNREIDKFVESLSGQYGDQVPIQEAFELLQKLERATGETDTVNQP